jgi:hypothetical protein
MTEAAAGDAALMKGGISSLAEFGISGLALCLLVWLIYKLAIRWIDTAVKREERDAEIRKCHYEALNGVAAALNKNTEAIQIQIAAQEHHIASMDRVAAGVGNLPCTNRDPSLRTRASDYPDMPRLGYDRVEVAHFHAEGGD